MRPRHYFAFVVATMLTGCCAVPPPCKTTRCRPDQFSPSAIEFAPESNRYPYLDQRNRWRLLSEPEFQGRFGLESVGQNASR